MVDPLGQLICPLRIMCMVSIPVISRRAVWNVLNPIMGLTRRLIARWSCSTMLLRYFRLAQFNGHATVGDQSSHGCGVGAALVNRDLLGDVMQINGSLEESAGRRYIAPSGEQEVHGVPELVDGAV